MRKALLATMLLSLLIANESFAQTDSFNNSGQGSFSNNNCTAFGTGNVVCSPYRYGFSEQLGEQLLANMPDKSKKVVLQTVGSGADQEVGTQVQQFLTQNGYTVQRMSIGIMAPPPDHPFALQADGKQYVLTVAPSAH